MSDDLVDDLLGGEDEEELGNEDESVLQDIFGPNSGNLKTNKEPTLDIENEIAINRVAYDDDEFMKDFDEALDEKLKKSEKIGKPLVIPPSLAAPPGLNVFSQIKGEHAFRYFSFDDLCLEKDFDYKRRPYLKGHGFSDQTIDDIVSDKITFLRHLMPSAQSLLICDEKDFRTVMNYLLYCISVCQDRLLSDCLMKSFFDLAKNYDFSWRLNLKHVVTVLVNYGIQDHAIDHCCQFFKIKRKKSKELKPSDLEATFLTARRKNKSLSRPDKIEDEKFSFCLSRFVETVCEVVIAQPFRVDLRNKADVHDLCAFAFLMNIVATDIRFVEDYLILDCVSNMYSALFDSIPTEYWYSGPVKKGERPVFGKDNFPKLFSLLLADFPKEDKMDPFRTWEKVMVSSKSKNNTDHIKNIQHKVELMPPSYRGSQVKRYLAFLYLYIQLHVIVQEVDLPNYPYVNDILQAKLLLSDETPKTMFRILIKRKYFPHVLIIIRLLDTCIGNEVEESFTVENSAAIREFNKGYLDLAHRLLPSFNTFGDNEKLQDLGDLRACLDVIKERWSNGCDAAETREKMSDSEDDITELTQQQQDKLAQLQDLTGIEDTNICRALLESNNWDLEATAREHLGIHQEEPQLRQDQVPELPNIGQPDPGGLRQRRNQQQRDEHGVGARALRRHAAGGNSLVSLIMYILSMPLRIVTTSIDGAMGFITSLFGFPPQRRSTVRDPQRDVSKFVQDFESSYGSEHPEFFVGSYSQVLEEAKKELKFLLVYLHSEDHQDTDRFCTDVLCNQELRSYISDNFIVWGCSVKYPEGHRVSEALRESTYPFLAVVVLRQHRMVVVGRQEGYIQPQPLVAWLEQTVREYESFIVAARADRDERNFNREIRNEQDAIFAETLRKDQEEEERRRAEEARQREAEEEERLQVEQERRRIEEEEEKKSRIQIMKIELATQVPCEPELSCKEAIRILIKLPEGQRLERRFLPTHTLHHLYYFVFCHPDSPDEFDIVTNFPRRVLACKPTGEGDEPLTLAQAGFGKSEMLFVNDLEA